MNVTNLKKTRDHIAAHPDDYYQMRYRNPCGTPACVAGYAVVACGGTLTRWDQCMTADGRTKLIEDYGQELLALDTNQRAAMFAAVPYLTYYSAPTAAEALAMLDHAIEHGTVRWPERS